MVTHAIWQAPPVHEGVPLALEHTMPQPPQLAMSVPLAVSQPSLSLLLLQSEKPAMQAPLQTPAAQVGMGTLFMEQACGAAMVLQPPQLAGSTVVLISQPSAALALQSA